MYVEELIAHLEKHKGKKRKVYFNDTKWGETLVTHCKVDKMFYGEPVVLSYVENAASAETKEVVEESDEK